MFSLNRKYLTPFILVTGIVLSLLLTLLHYTAWANGLLLVILLVGSFPYFRDIYESIQKHQFGVDVLALASILASILARQYLAGTVILLMLSGGELLEERAFRHTRKALTAILAAAPTQAHKKVGRDFKDVPIEEVRVGDVVLVKPNEIIPVDGEVLSHGTVVDESKLTGESVPVEKTKFMQVMSGSLNLQSAIEVQALRPSSESKYEQIIRLVKSAEAQKAPFIRLADRYSVIFTVLAFGIAASAWMLSGSFTRFLAVLVVATPCPLILAAPTAFAAGMGRAAKRGILLKNGASIEKLAQAKSFLFDKTGTLTIGTPQVRAVTVLNKKYSEEEVLCIATSLDQPSIHILARALLNKAKELKLSLTMPDKYHEELGNGVIGEVKGKKYVMGKLKFLQKQGIQIDHLHQNNGSGIMTVFLAESKTVVAQFEFEDFIRDNTQHVFRQLHQLIPHVTMVTGDKKEVAQQVGEHIGVSDVRAELLPDEKLDVLRAEQQKRRPVVMVGDGVNDAPALAASDVGIALGGYGSSAATEAGDVVILTDDLQKIIEILQISKKTVAIALQCILVGIGLSVVLMLISATGLIPPLYGAMLQELIDVIVILNALRAGF